MTITLDDAFDLIGQHSPEYGGALSDHTPMVVEALDRLGRVELVGPYLARTLPQRRRLELETSPALDAYRAHFEQARDEIGRVGWTVALVTQLPQLVDGIAGAAFHGTLRVAHAVRALTRADTEPRQLELARAVAYARLCAATLPRASGAGDRPLVDASIGPAPGLARALTESAAQALAAMRVAFVGEWQPRVEAEKPLPTNDQQERALASLDDHAIKLRAALEAMPELDADECAQALAMWLAHLQV